jgi:hypothetical protein
MESFAEGGASGAGQQVDESAVAPTSKAHEPPLRPVDQLRLRMGFSPNRISIDGKVTVVRGMQAAADFLVVCAAALIMAGGAAGLCYIWHASGLSTFLITASAGAITFAAGLVYVLVRRARD